MSAWIVTKAHIDVLVKALVEYHVALSEVIPARDDFDALGQMLWEENHRSINTDRVEVTPAYTYSAPPTIWTPSELLHHIACYVYQTCEHDGWTESRTNALLHDLKTTLEEGFGGQEDNVPNGTPWGVPDCGGNHGHIHCPVCLAIGDTFPSPPTPDALEAWLA